MQVKIFKFLVCFAFALSFSTANALTIDTKSIKNNKTFGIEFPDGTSFYGIADWIATISKQEYLVGPLAVTEVSIDLLGATSKVRIYNVKMISATDIAGLANSQIPQNIPAGVQIPLSVTNAIKAAEANYSTADLSQVKVSKDYPATTHSHTLEFIVNDATELNLFYEKFLSDYTGKPFEASKGGDSSSVTINGLDNKIGVAGKTYIIDGEGVSFSGNEEKRNSSGMKKQDSKKRDSKK